MRPAECAKVDMSKSIRIGLIVVGIAAIYAVSALSMSGKTTEVEVGSVEAKPVRTTILASGEISFVNSVDLRPEITGVVSKVNVKAGTFVRSGDILLEFDQSTLNAELRQQTANIVMQQASVMRSKEAMSRARRQAARSKEIHDRQLISRDSYDEIVTTAELAAYDYRIASQNLEMAAALRERIDENLRKTVIRAPFDGRVIDVAIKQGETAVAGITNIAGSQLLTLADTRDVVANLFIDEIDIGRVRLGQKVEVDIVAFPGKKLVGEIAELSLAAEPKQNSESLKYEAQVSFPNGTQLPVRKRMTVRAEIVVSSENADLSVPLRAVLREPGGGQEPHHFVFVVVDGRARKKSIELGRSDDEYQVIESGVKRGDSLVVGPYQTLKGLKDGDTVAARAVSTVK
jgi:HlyD family secretion protein